MSVNTATHWGGRGAQGGEERQPKRFLILKLWYPWASVNTISHFLVHVESNTYRDVTFHMRVIWESQVFFLSVIAGITEDNLFLTSHSFGGMAINNMLLTPRNRNFGICFLYWKTLKYSTNNNCTQVSLRNVNHR